MPIPDSFIDELIGRTDITELVSGYVRLTKRSGSNMFGLCPFHTEKTPSFSVNADKQIYYCFGCGKGGGAVNFVMSAENMTFTDAVEFLASRAGMTVPSDDTSLELAGKRKRMLELNREAARFFFDMLRSPLAGPARQYLSKRGISKEMVTRFGIGAAPDSWSLLLDAMTLKGYSRQELSEAGLIKSGRSGDSAYDVFRNRLIFPVIDARGSVVGFSGRILSDDEPKYLNSPDTLVFNKSSTLFALNLARKTKQGMLILVEGNIDVVALHMAGFDGAVASLGTSFTTQQARLMSRYSDNAVIAFDSDEAGKRAALKAIPLLEKTGMSVRVLSLDGAKDPDEYIKAKGADAFRNLLERSEGHIDYRLLVIENNADMSTDEGRLKYITAATELLANLDSKPEREVYGARVAKVGGVSAESIAVEVAKAVRIKRSKAKKEFEKQVTRPTLSVQPKDKKMRYTDEFSATAEEGILRCLMLNPSLMSTISETGFSQEEFTSQFLAKLFGIVTARLSQGLDISEASLMARLEPEEAAQLTRIFNQPESLPQSERTLCDYIEKIRERKYSALDPDSGMLMAIKQFRKEKKDTGGN